VELNTVQIPNFYQHFPYQTGHRLTCWMDGSNGGNYPSPPILSRTSAQGRQTVARVSQLFVRVEPTDAGHLDQPQDTR
jgi:hypothetical protein